MTLILDNLPPSLSEALAQRARLEGRPLHEIAVEALSRGLTDPPLRRDLDDIAGTWVEDPAFDQAVKEFEQIDSDLWK